MVSPRFVALSLFAFPVAVLADSEDGQREPARPPHPPRFAHRLMVQLDVDRSGDISREEFTAHPRLEKANEEQQNKLFQRLDKNQDNVLQPRELQPPQRSEKRDRRPEGPISFEQFAEQSRVKKLSEKRKRELFDKLDSNKDGQLTREDSQGRRPGPRADKKGDRKKDNKLPMQLDLNQDEKISFGEFFQHPRHKRLGEDEAEDRFEAIDQNNDGFLSYEELKNRPETKAKKKTAPKKSSPPPSPESKEEMNMMSGE